MEKRIRYWERFPEERLSLGTLLQFMLAFVAWPLWVS